MSRCNKCNTIILFGGVADAGLRFCSTTCAESAQLAIVGQTLPEREVRKCVWDVYKGNCPDCGGTGPVDMRMSYRVFSLIFFTNWSSQTKMACRGCGMRGQLLALVTCALFGWWGFPWGLLITPVQIIRNIVALLSGDSEAPSAALDKVVRIQLAQQLMQAPPPPAPAAAMSKAS